MVKEYYIFTDGGALNPTGKEGVRRWASGAGIIINRDDHEIEKGFSILKPDETNQYGELKSALIALKHMIRLNEETGTKSDIIFYSDSQYVIKGITEWIKGWQRNGWKNSKNIEISHKEIWQEFYKCTMHPSIHKLKFIHIRGHQNSKKNEFPYKFNFYVDDLCNKRFNNMRKVI